MSRHLSAIKALDDLNRIFGEDFGTAQVLANPSADERATALSAVDTELDLALLVRDLAIISAREVANVLERHAMRAADYADVPELWQSVLKKLGKALGKDSEAFILAFQEHLQARG